jgi:hypothetical protein
LDALLQGVGNYGLRGRLLADPEIVGPWSRRLIGLATLLFGAAVPLLLIGAALADDGGTVLTVGWLCAIVGFGGIIAVRTVLTLRALREAPEDG